MTRIANATTEPEAHDGDEITPEMIEAGAAVLERHYLGDGVYDLRHQVIGEIYHSMHRLWRIDLIPS